MFSAGKVNDVKKFSLDGTKYDQSTYSGRFRAFLDIIDPTMLFVSQQRLQHSLDLLDQFKQGKLAQNNEIDKQLWNARKVKEAVIHPVTGQKIFPLFRMAAFVPSNVPLVAGMLNAQGTGATLFWQWLNQSYNSAINYANGSGSSSSNNDIGKSYLLAVTVSCCLAVGMKYAGNSQRSPQIIRRIASVPFVVPFTAVASAGSANVVFSRQNELNNGVKVFDKDGNELGLSKVAAKQGVVKTVLSRAVLLPIPVMILPHFVMKAVPKSWSPRARTLSEVVVITVAICLFLPATIAIFPQRLEFKADALEKEFQNLGVDTLYCNKGL